MNNNIKKKTEGERVRIVKTCVIHAKWNKTVCAKPYTNKVTQNSM